MSNLDRPMPSAADAEKAVLGSMLLDETAIHEAGAYLPAGPREFFVEKHGLLYETLTTMERAGERTDDGTVIADELRARGLFDKLGGYDFLGGLVSSVPSAHRAVEYAKIVHEKYLLRRLIGTGWAAVNAAYDAKGSTHDILADASREMLTVCEEGARSEAVQLDGVIAGMIEKFQDQQPLGLETPFSEYDELTGGLQSSELVIVAARPSMGKTAFALDLAQHTVLGLGKGVLFFSLEMSRHELGQRILAGMGDVDLLRLRKHQATDLDVQNMQFAEKRLHGKPLYIDATAGISIEDLSARAHVARRRQNIELVCVDYLQRVRVERRGSNRYLDVAEISGACKALAKNLNVPVIVMCQLNRQIEDRAVPRPRLADLRESGDIEADADVVLLLGPDWRRMSDEERANFKEGKGCDRVNVHVAKQRNGPTGEFSLWFDRSRVRFSVSPPRDEEEEATSPEQDAQMSLHGE